MYKIQKGWMIKSKFFSDMIRPTLHLLDFQVYLWCWRYHYYLFIWCCVSTCDARHLCLYIKCSCSIVWNFCSNISLYRPRRLFIVIHVVKYVVFRFSAFLLIKFFLFWSVLLIYFVWSIFLQSVLTITKFKFLFTII